MASCYTCIRYLMFGFNVFFLLIGMAVMGFGIWCRVDESLHKYVADGSQLSALHTLAYTIIGIGVFIIVTSFLGCCGACFEKQFMLVIFFILLSIVAIIFNAAAIWSAIAFSGMTPLEGVIKAGLESGVDNYFVEGSFGRDYMDLVQNEFECCGASLGIADYPRTKGILVKACQKYTQPCLDQIEDYFYSYIEYSIATMFVIGVTAIIGMVFSMVLCCTIKDRE